MSSLRNAVKRITHKERSQPRARAHLGLLEKKKDYKKRAIDYHKKSDRIKAMRQKAAMKNPDEFYFGMNRSKVVDGKHRSFENSNQLPTEMIDLMKSQDLSYIRMQKQKDTKKAEKLQASLHLLESVGGEATKKRKHTVFVESEEVVGSFDVAEHFDTVPQLAGRSFNRLRKKDIEKLAKARTTVVDENEEEHQPTAEALKKRAKVERKLARKLARAKSAAYGEMEARVNRAKAMQQAEDHLTTEKLMSSKGRKRKVKAAEGGKPAQYKWRRRRLG